jgi:hypothetical protein
VKNAKVDSQLMICSLEHASIELVGLKLEDAVQVQASREKPRRQMLTLERDMGQDVGESTDLRWPQFASGV